MRDVIFGQTNFRTVVEALLSQSQFSLPRSELLAFIPCSTRDGRRIGLEIPFDTENDRPRSEATFTSIGRLQV